MQYFCILDQILRDRCCVWATWIKFSKYSDFWTRFCVTGVVFGQHASYFYNIYNTSTFWIRFCVTGLYLGNMDGIFILCICIYGILVFRRFGPDSA